MKTISALFGITGSILVSIYAAALVFFRHEILPVSTGASGFDPDSFTLLVSGLLGLFGCVIGAAGSALSLSDSELSGIMLLGAAVSGAIMFAALTAMFPLVTMSYLNRYVTLATGIIACIALSAAGVISLNARRESKEEVEK